jgi:Family of unknown function (DUF5343)
MADKLPYVTGYGVITKALQRIKTAATPPRFTQDFLGTKLNLKGGSARPVIPFLKRAGFLGSDGVPTDVYKRFRNPTESGRAAAIALLTAYQPLYELNESVHDLSEKDLRGLIVQITGAEPDSQPVRVILGSFKALKSFATFTGDDKVESGGEDNGGEKKDDAEVNGDEAKEKLLHMGLSYTINLNLPATSDIAVFNAIFKSLKDHLLR